MPTLISHLFLTYRDRDAVDALVAEGRAVGRTAADEIPDGGRGRRGGRTRNEAEERAQAGRGGDGAGLDTERRRP